MANKLFKLPLTNIPQKFSINLAGRALILTVKYNNSGICWEMQITDETTNEAITGFFPLVTGTDLLAQLAYLGINGSLYAYTDGDELAVPTQENLGTECNVYFVTPDE